MEGKKIEVENMEVQTKFDINTFLENFSSSTSSSKLIDSNFNQELSFEGLIEKVKEVIESYFANLSDNEEKKRQYFDIESAAILGSEKEERMIMSEIEKILREHNWLNVEYPSTCYDSLVEGVFHEIYRFGLLKKWDRFWDSPSAKIVGNKMKFKINGFFQVQEERLNPEFAWQVIRRLSDRFEGIVINTRNPSAEIDMYDGTRVEIMIPPIVSEPTIIFRRFIFKNFTFKHLASKGTIDINDINLYEALARCHLNTIISGPVESGKSTLLKIFFAARDPKYSSVLIEDTRETFLQRDFPDRDVIEIYSADSQEQIYKAISLAMRIDHDFLMFQEVRAIEADGAIHSMQKGTRGSMFTCHISDPEDTPEQLSQYIVDFYPNRSQDREIRRISRNLDIGITTNQKDGRKFVSSIYEFIYDKNTRESYVNYLVKFDDKLKRWEYNGDISEHLIKRMKDFDEHYAEQFITLLRKRALIQPIKGQTKVRID